MGQGTYKITEARQGRTYTGKHGDLVVWLVKLENATAETPGGEFELHKKPGNTPNPGDSIEVKTFSPGEHDGTPYVRIFVESQSSTATAPASSPQSSSGPGLAWRSAPFERGAEHPRNEVRMIHTSALSAAVPFINQLLAFGVAEAPKDEDAYWALVGRVAARLRDSYQGPLSRVGGSQGAPQAALSNGGEVPADMTGLGNGSPVADESIPFARPRIPDRETRRRDLFVGDRCLA